MTDARLSEGEATSRFSHVKNRDLESFLQVIEGRHGNGERSIANGQVGGHGILHINLNMKIKTCQRKIK